MTKHKGLGSWDIFTMAAGSMISSGLYILPALAFQKAGSGMIVSYLVAGVFMLPAILGRLELSTALPKSGGLYYLLERILGTGPGLMAGMTDWLMIILKASFSLVGIEAFVLFIYPAADPWLVKLAALGVLGVFTWVNLVSVEHTGSLQALMVMGLLGCLILFLLAGYPHFDPIQVADNFKPDIMAILSTASLVFISYGGISKIANVAEEVRNPGVSLVRGILVAYLVVQTLYVLVVALLCGILPGADLAGADLPLSEAALRITAVPLEGPILAVVMAAGGILAFLTTANAGLLSASRIPYAMARDELLPGFLATASKKQGIPRPAVVLTAAAMAAALLFLDLEQLAKIASGFMLFQFALQMLAILVVRRLPSRNYQPMFRLPLAPVMASLSVLLYLGLLVTLGWMPVLAVVGFALASAVWYLAYARKNVSRESALAKILAGIAGDELLPVDDPLENEMLDILLHRERIEEDRVDAMIRSATVLDLDGGSFTRAGRGTGGLVAGDDSGVAVGGAATDPVAAESSPDTIDSDPGAANGGSSRSTGGTAVGGPAGPVTAGSEATGAGVPVAGSTGAGAGAPGSADSGQHVLDRKDLFALMARAIAPRWDSSPDDIAAKLEAREQDCPTLLYPGVALPHAIPHAILPGEHRFEIVLVRSKEGIVWNDTGETVHTAFGLFGTKDERTFHLQCLAAIAQTLQDPTFQTRWNAARDEQELRNILLLSRRKRWTS